MMESKATGDDEVPAGSSKPRNAPTLPIRRLCSLSLHDASSSTEDILLDTSLFPPESVRTGDIMQIVAVEGFENRSSGATENFQIDKSRSKPTGQAEGEERIAPLPSIDPQNFDHLLIEEKNNIFVVKNMSMEMLSKQQNIQVGHCRNQSMGAA